MEWSPSLPKPDFWEPGALIRLARLSGVILHDPPEIFSHLNRNDDCWNIALSMPERKLRRGRRRRSGRLSAQIPVQLAETSDTGQQILENTRTLMLSQCGASILSKRKLIPEREMMIRRLD